MRSVESATILVIDNGSDDSSEIDRVHRAYSNIEILRNERNIGFTGAYNQGLRWAESMRLRYIMILNNDTIADYLLLNNLMKTIGANSKSIVSPKVVFANSGKIQNIGGIFHAVFGPGNWKKNQDPKKYQSLYHPDFLSGCCWLMPLQAFRDIGPFDENFFAYAEDIDYSWRARRAGYQLIVDGKAILLHAHSASTRGGYSKVFYIARNHPYLLRKYGRSSSARFLLLLKLFLSHAVLYKGFRWVPFFFSGIRAYRRNIFGEHLADRDSAYTR